MSIECERVAQEMSVPFASTPGIYFRFNVDQGLQNIGPLDWEKTSEVMVHTRTYLIQSENSGRMTQLVSTALDARKNLVATKHLSECMLNSGGHVIIAEPATIEGVIPTTLVSNHTIGECPPPSPLFVDRVTIVACIERCLLDGSNERRVFALYRFGGAGKTQLALRFVELHKERYIPVLLLYRWSYQFFMFKIPTCVLH